MCLVGLRAITFHNNFDQKNEHKSFQFSRKFQAQKCDFKFKNVRYTESLKYLIELLIKNYERFKFSSRFLSNFKNRSPNGIAE